MTADDDINTIRQFIWDDHDLGDQATSDALDRLAALLAAKDAEIERLLDEKAALSSRIRVMTTELRTSHECEMRVVRERDEARAEIERLRGLVVEDVNRMNEWRKTCESLEHEIEWLRQALRFYADLGADDIPYHDTINDPPDVGRTARAALAAAAQQPPGEDDKD